MAMSFHCVVKLNLEEINCLITDDGSLHLTTIRILKIR